MPLHPVEPHELRDVTGGGGPEAQSGRRHLSGMTAIWKKESGFFGHVIVCVFRLVVAGIGESFYGISPTRDSKTLLINYDAKLDHPRSALFIRIL